MLQQNAVEPATLELLKGICALPQFKDFALGGGTNLALRFGHRLSVDVCGHWRKLVGRSHMHAGIFSDRNSMISRIAQRTVNIDLPDCFDLKVKQNMYF
jgi:hypothetical protein